MAKFYVALDSITDEQLAFLGYTLIKENEKFKVYTDYSGDDHIVYKERPFIYVDDVNDVLYLNASIVINAPN